MEGPGTAFKGYMTLSTCNGQWLIHSFGCTFLFLFYFFAISQVCGFKASGCKFNCSCGRLLEVSFYLPHWFSVHTHIEDNFGKALDCRTRV